VWQRVACFETESPFPISQCLVNIVEEILFLATVMMESQVGTLFLLFALNSGQVQE